MFAITASRDSAMIMARPCQQPRRHFEPLHGRRAREYFSYCEAAGIFGPVSRM